MCVGMYIYIYIMCKILGMMEKEMEANFQVKDYRV